MINRPAEVNDDLNRRLRRIEGQVRGVQKMVEEGQPPAAVLQQLTAISSAVRGTALKLVQAYLSSSLDGAGGFTYQEMQERKIEMMDLLERVP